MTPEEKLMVKAWIVYGWDDDMLGANWQQNLKNHGLTPPWEVPSITGKRIRSEVEQKEAV